MVDSSLLQLVDTGTPEPSARAKALLSMKREIDAQTAYQESIAQSLFGTPAVSGEKERLKFERILLATSNLGILAILWKESAYICDEDLAQAELTRSFSQSEPLTCHSLATFLAETPKALAKTLKKIEGFVAAAEAFGLVERASMKGRNERWKELRGTQKLADLMISTSGSLDAARQIGANACSGATDDLA